MPRQAGSQGKDARAIGTRGLGTQGPATYEMPPKWCASDFGMHTTSSLHTGTISTEKVN